MSTTTFNLARPDLFPETTSVGAYPASSFYTADLPPTGAPRPSAVATATVTSGVAAFTGLTANTAYFFAASVSGTWRYVKGRTDVSSQSLVVPIDVRNYGAKCDLATRTDGAITSGQNQLTCSGYTFTTADIGKEILVMGAGTPYTDKGAYANSTAYAAGDMTTNPVDSSLKQIPLANQAIAGDALYEPNHWCQLRDVNPSLIGTITGVSSGKAVLSANAGRTVTAATVTFGTDDTAAHAAAIDACTAAGGGDVFSPGDTMVRNVYVKSHVRLRLGKGRFMPRLSGSGGNVFGLHTTNTGEFSIGCSIVAEYGVINADYTGVPPTGTSGPGNAHFIWVDRAYDWSIEGIVRGTALPHSNVVLLIAVNGGLVPTLGHIDVVEAKNSTYNYGAVQVDACDGVTINRTVCDMGRSLNLEPDSVGVANALTVDGVQCRKVVQDARSLEFSNSALGLVAHDNIIRNVQVDKIDLTNAKVEAIRVAGDAMPDDITIGKVRVTGGGRATYVDHPSSFDHFTIDSVYVDGAEVWDAVNGLFLPALEMSPGMEVGTVFLVNSSRRHVETVFHNPIATGTARIKTLICDGSESDGVLNESIEVLEIGGGSIANADVSAFNVGTGSIIRLRGQVTGQGGSNGRKRGSGLLIEPTMDLVNTVAATGATETLPDVDQATVHRLTLDANCTVTFPTAAAGKSFTVVVVQDATGSRTVTWPGTVKWAAGTAPTLTTTASKRDVLTFICADGTNWLGFVAGQNYA